MSSGLTEKAKYAANKNEPGALARAVIYARVSSAKQVSEGSGLSSQETRCREYAKFKGYDVSEVFTDDMTGGIAGRPGMNAMLAYLRKHRRDPHVVIIDDISRFARGLEAHLALRTSIAKAGGVLQSPSIEFGEDSDSVLVENLLASAAPAPEEFRAGRQPDARPAAGRLCVFGAPARLSL
jgi:site-specific DNA recombinase